MRETFLFRVFFLIETCAKMASNDVCLRVCVCALGYHILEKFPFASIFTTGYQIATICVVSVQNRMAHNREELLYKLNRDSDSILSGQISMCHWINKQPSSICLNWVNIIPCCVCVLYLAFYLFMAEFLLLSFHLIPLFLLIAVLRTALQSKSLFHCYYLRAFWRNGRFRLPTHVLCVCVCVLLANINIFI